MVRKLRVYNYNKGMPNVHKLRTVLQLQRVGVGLYLYVRKSYYAPDGIINLSSFIFMIINKTVRLKKYNKYAPINLASPFKISQLLCVFGYVGEVRIFRIKTYVVASQEEEHIIMMMLSCYTRDHRNCTTF